MSPAEIRLQDLVLPVSCTKLNTLTHTHTYTQKKNSIENLPPLKMRHYNKQLLILFIEKHDIATCRNRVNFLNVFWTIQRKISKYICMYLHTAFRRFHTESIQYLKVGIVNLAGIFHFYGVIQASAHFESDKQIYCYTRMSF